MMLLSVVGGQCRDWSVVLTRRYGTRINMETVFFVYSFCRTRFVLSPQKNQLETPNTSTWNSRENRLARKLTCSDVGQLFSRASLSLIWVKWSFVSIGSSSSTTTTTTTHCVTLCAADQCFNIIYVKCCALCPAWCCVCTCACVVDGNLLQITSLALVYLQCVGATINYLLFYLLPKSRDNTSRSRSLYRLFTWYTWHYYTLV